MEVLQVAIAILIGSLLYPWITKIISYFSFIIPSWILNFMYLGIFLKLILFIIHRGDEG